jgi:hypothetical protein
MDYCQAPADELIGDQQLRCFQVAHKSDMGDRRNNSEIGGFRIRWLFRLSISCPADRLPVALQGASPGYPMGEQLNLLQ